VPKVFKSYEVKVVITYMVDVRSPSKTIAKKLAKKLVQCIEGDAYSGNANEHDPYTIQFVDKKAVRVDER
jgi:hypothetical protein